MIFDIAKRSLQSESVLIPVESLLGNVAGSRMPTVNRPRVGEVEALID